MAAIVATGKSFAMVHGWIAGGLSLLELWAWQHPAGSHGKTQQYPAGLVGRPAGTKHAEIPVGIRGKPLVVAQHSVGSHGFPRQPTKTILVPHGSRGSFHGTPAKTTSMFSPTNWCNELQYTLRSLIRHKIGAGRLAKHTPAPRQSFRGAMEARCTRTHCLRPRQNPEIETSYDHCGFYCSV